MPRSGLTLCSRRGSRPPTTLRAAPPADRAKATLADTRPECPRVAPGRPAPPPHTTYPLLHAPSDPPRIPGPLQPTTWTCPRLGPPTRFYPPVATMPRVAHVFTRPRLAVAVAEGGRERSVFARFPSSGDDGRHPAFQAHHVLVAVRADQGIGALRPERRGFGVGRRPGAFGSAPTAGAMAATLELPAERWAVRPVQRTASSVGDRHGGCWQTTRGSRAARHTNSRSGQRTSTSCSSGPKGPLLDTDLRTTPELQVVALGTPPSCYRYM